MKLQILSDLHIEFKPFTFIETNADIVILAGDVNLGMRGFSWIQQNIPQKTVLYIPGNHEFYKTATPRLINKLKKASTGTHIHVLENEAMIIEDFIFLGCTFWTDFNVFVHQERSIALAKLHMNDYKYIRKSPQYTKILPSYTTTWHCVSLKWMTHQLDLHKDKQAVIITHHAPSLLSVPYHERENPLMPAYVSGLDNFVDQSKAKLWVHGHVHRASDYFIGNTRIVCNPRGYPDEPVKEFRPDLMIEV